MPTDPQIFDMSVYFKQATIWGFLFFVLPAALILVGFFVVRRHFKKRLPKEEEKPPEPPKDPEAGPVGPSDKINEKQT